VNALELIAEAALSGRALEARSLVQDWTRSEPDIAKMPPPVASDPTLVALTASLAEMFAGRLLQSVPSWTAAIGPRPVAIYLVPSALRMKNLKTLCEIEGPLELRRRNFFAPPGYLTFA